MLTRRAAAVAAAAAAAALVLTACEPLDTDGRSTSTSTSTSSKSKSKSKSGSARTTHRVEYRTSDGKAPARRSTVVRSGATARVTSRGSGSVSCRIVIDGRTVAQRSGSGSVTCSAPVGR